MPGKAAVKPAAVDSDAHPVAVAWRSNGYDPRLRTHAIVIAAARWSRMPQTTATYRVYQFPGKLMSSAEVVDQVSAQLLAPTGLDVPQLERVLGGMQEHALDYSELYFQCVRSESWVLEDQRVKDASFNVEQGVGVRALAAEKTGFAYSDDLVLDAVQQASSAARTIAKRGVGGSNQSHRVVAAPQRYFADNPVESLSDEDKVAFLQRLDGLARSIDNRVVEVTCALVARYETMLVPASDGTLAADIRPLLRVNVSVITEENGRRERGSAGAGGRFDFGWFGAEQRAEDLASEAVRLALVNLEAVAAPAGEMPVVLGNGWPGVLLHEAVGHGLEGDFNRKGTSTFSGRIGQQVASPLCTVVDDGTLMDRRGSITVDDEGVPGQRNVLIERGILTGYLQDKLNARLMNVAPTGNGRRESYSHMPLPRMTNTFMEAGDAAPEDIIKSVKRGIYAANFGGGQVDITSGRFVFSTTEAYLIEDGKVTAPVKGPTLIGNGPYVMNQITMVGNDLALDQGVGVCGKDGQSVPVGVGQPTLRIDALTVGGTQE